MKKLFTLLILALTLPLFANAKTGTVFYENYADIVYKNLPFTKEDGTQSLNRISSTKTTLAETDTWKFNLTFNGNLILNENDYLTISKPGGNSASLRYNSDSNIGLYTGSTETATVFGVLGLKAGDIVEVAYHKASTNEIKSLLNLSEPKSLGDSSITLTKEDGEISDYKIKLYSMTIQTDGDAAFSLAGSYIAYIRITREIVLPDVDEEIFKVDFSKLADEKIGYGGAQITLIRNTTSKRMLESISTFPFTITFKDETQLGESELSISRSDMLLRYNGNSNIGLFTRNDDNYIAVSDVKAGDKIEIAYRSSSDSEVSINTCINLSEPEYLGVYSFAYFLNNNRTTDFSKYIMTVKDDGIAGFILDDVYISYIKVLRARTDEYRGHKVTINNQSLIPNTEGVAYFEKVALGGTLFNVEVFDGLNTTIYGADNMEVDINPSQWIQLTGSGGNLMEIIGASDSSVYDLEFDINNNQLYVTPRSAGEIAVPGHEDKTSEEMTITTNKNYTLFYKTYILDPNAIDETEPESYIRRAYAIPETYEDASAYHQGNGVYTFSKTKMLEEAKETSIPKGKLLAVEVYAQEPDGNKSNVKLISFDSDGVVTSVSDMAADVDAPVRYFNLQGVEVANPENGIFIKVQGNKVSKVFVK